MKINEHIDILNSADSLFSVTELTNTAEYNLYKICLYKTVYTLLCKSEIREKL